MCLLFECIYIVLCGVILIECDLVSNEYVVKFRKVMDDDFNMLEVLFVLFEFVKELNCVKDSDVE